MWQTDSGWAWLAAIVHLPRSRAAVLSSLGTRELLLHVCFCTTLAEVLQCSLEVVVRRRYEKWFSCEEKIQPWLVWLSG